MNVLVLDGSGAQGRLALVAVSPGGAALLSEACVEGRGGAERLAGNLREMLGTADRSIAALGLIAVIVGPGSFTGLRATLALAHGLHLGGGCPLIGVGLGEALRRTAGPQAAPVWCVTQARRGRIFLDREPDGPIGCMLADLPRPDGALGSGDVLLAGDASAAVAPLLAAAGVAARVLRIEHPGALAIADVAGDRLAGRLAPVAVQPLYVDPPEASRPARGLRPAPV